MRKKFVQEGEAVYKTNQGKNRFINAEKSVNMSHNKCHACGDAGYFVECKDVKSETKPVKVVHNEVIGLITDEDPVVSKMRRRGWYLASRCTVHVCNSRDMFVDYQPWTVHVCNSRDMFVDYQPWTGHEVVLDFNSRAEVAGIGSVELHFTTGKVLRLLNVFHIPTIRKCLLSACILLGNDYIISMDATRGTTIEKNHEIVGKGYLEDGLIRMSIIKPDSEPAKGMV
uniref:Retrovirus-related Pol polyprotein from transposon TNT 1-94-like beta-barrel domain-containing protein n=1 Tax=Helianthus annuus TaxID=4232 RepID=A0A251T387_HELAN